MKKNGLNKIKWYSTWILCKSLDIKKYVLELYYVSFFDSSSNLFIS